MAIQWILEALRIVHERRAEVRVGHLVCDGFLAPYPRQCLVLTHAALISFLIQIVCVLDFAFKIVDVD